LSTAGVILALAVGGGIVVLIRLMERARRELFQMERLAVTGTLAAAMAHDVKNPLSIILSTVQLMADEEDLSTEHRTLIRNIEEETKRSCDQLDAFLDLARDMPMRKTREDIRDLLTGTTDMIKSGRLARNITVDIVLPNRPVYVVFDRAKIRRALLNVLINALEAFEDPENPRITVVLKEPLADDDLPPRDGFGGNVLNLLGLNFGTEGPTGQEQGQQRQDHGDGAEGVVEERLDPSP